MADGSVRKLVTTFFSMGSDPLSTNSVRKLGRVPKKTVKQGVCPLLETRFARTSVSFVAERSTNSVSKLGAHQDEDLLT